MLQKRDLRYLFRHYFVSEVGEVFSNYSGELRQLKPRINNSGYARVLLSIERGKQKEFLVHRLVAMVFLPKIWAKPLINHLDRNRLNNRADNLEWCTQKENMIHAFEMRPSKGKVIKNIYWIRICVLFGCTEKSDIVTGLCSRHTPLWTNRLEEISQA